MINFRVDGRSGVPPYLQLVQQVRLREKRESGKCREG